MAKWVNFDVIEIQRTGPQTANIIKLQNVPMRADAVVMIIPTVIPSEVAGPNGEPAQRPGASLSFMGAGLQGPAVMVDATKEEVLWKLENGPFVEIKEPKVESISFQEKKSGKPDLKNIHPGE